jgi:hypothetical protein
LSSVGLYAVDKVTKTVKVYKLENKRNLNIEKIIFSGLVKNEGAYEIGKVYLEIALLNNSKGMGNTSFVNPFLSFGWGSSKPSQIVEEFVIAENLKPGEVKDFIVYMRYPSHFEGFSTSYEISSH